MNPKQEPKYEIKDGKLHNRQSGQQIPDDEPVFILRAKDRGAAATLSFYHSRVMDNEHAKAVFYRMQQFQLFAEEHPDRMQQADTTLTDDWKP